MFRKLTLADMAHTTGLFTTKYATLEKDDYAFTYKTGHEVTITKFFGLRPYSVTLYSPQHESNGSAAGFNSAEEALEYFNKLVEADELNKSIHFTRADHNAEFAN